MQSSKEIVQRCLTFNSPERMPRQLWTLPWANIHHPEKTDEILHRFPNDFTGVDYSYRQSTRMKGDPYKKGEYTDEWGCVFKNLEDGIFGEVRDPILKDISDWKSIEPPYEQLPKGELEIRAAYDAISRSYEKTDKFVFAMINPRPWERYQFIRGTENALIDLMMPDSGTKDLLRIIHKYNLHEIELWAKSDVDAISFMDDWGSQDQLLIPPDLWREMFKPLYKEYCDLVHSYGKFIFMHSDGFIHDIYPDLIEVGVDALNSQLFCMDMEYLNETAKGKITFWGEIDRQHVLPSTDPQVGRDAVQKVAKHLYDPTGGIIAQLEFGPGANPDTVIAVFEEWEEMERERKINSIITS